MTNLVTAIALLFLLAPPALCQEPFETEEMPPLAPQIVPVIPTVLPPEVPPRPPLIPVQSASSSAPAPLQKQPLAWRARAHRLKQSAAPQQKILHTTYDAAIMMLISALSPAGLRVEVLNSKSGELLAVPVEQRSSQKYIFVFSEMPPGVVTVKAAAWSASKSSSSMIDSVLQTMEQAGSSRSMR